MNSFSFHCKQYRRRHEDLLCMVEWMATLYTIHYWIMFYTKKHFWIYCYCFLFVRAITLICIWFRKGSLYGLFAFWYLSNSFTLKCFIFSPFIIDYLIFFFLTFWYIFISFFPFEYFNFIILCSFRCVSLRIFVSFSESKKECNSFLPFFVLAFSVRVYVTMKCCFCFNKYFFYTWYKMIRWPSC